MKIQHKNNTQSGFAIVEAIFVVVIIGVIVGGGVYLFQRKNDQNRNSPASQSSDFSY